MLAVWLRYNGPDTSLSFEIMMDCLLIVVIGGMGTIYGAVVGSVVFLIAQSYLQDLLRLASETASSLPWLAALLSPDRWLLWLGLLFVLSVTSPRVSWEAARQRRARPDPEVPILSPASLTAFTTTGDMVHEEEPCDCLAAPSPGALAALAAAVLAACGGDGGERNAKPGYLGTVRQQSYDGSSDDLLTAGLGKTAWPWPRRRALPARSNPRRPNCAAWPSTPLPRHAGHDCSGRLRHALRPQCGCAGPGDGRRRQDCRHRVHRVLGRRLWPQERHAHGAGAGQLRSQEGLHHHRHGFGLARRVRRHHHGRMGLKRGCAVAYSDKGTGAAPMTS